MIQQKPYSIGDIVRVHHVHGAYRLPDGLPDHAQVRVVKFDLGYRNVEYIGRIFRVAQASVDSGWIEVSRLRKSPLPRRVN